MTHANLSPILSQWPSIYLNKDEHITIGKIDTLDFIMKTGFEIGFIVQIESTEPSILAGTSANSGTTMLIRYNYKGQRDRICLDLQDDSGNRVVGFAQLSNFAAKRISISFDAKASAIYFCESNLFEDYRPPTQYEIRGNLKRISRFDHPMLFGAAFIGGKIHPDLRAKISLVFLFEGAFQQRSDQHTASFRRDQDAFYASSAYKSYPSRSRVQLFLSDLHDCALPMLEKPHFNPYDTRACSVLLYRWLLDRPPQNHGTMLQDLCNHLGIQLTLPGRSDQDREYAKSLMAMQPRILLNFTYGKQSFSGYRWRVIKDFMEDFFFNVGGHPIKIDGFIKFTRHKLGGAHFDEKNRKEWQREIASYSKYLEHEEDWLNVVMRTLLIAVWDGVSDCRIEQIARNALGDD